MLEPMKSSQKILGATFAAVLLAASVMVASPAAASSGSPAPASISAATPGIHTALSPTCVDVTKQGRSKGFPYVDVKNNCSSTQRVKAIWAWSSDSSCNTLRPGQSFRDSSGVAAVFDGLRKC